MFSYDASTGWNIVAVSVSVAVFDPSGIVNKKNKVNRYTTVSSYWEEVGPGVVC